MEPVSNQWPKANYLKRKQFSPITFLACTCEGKKMFSLMIATGIRITYGDSNRPEIYFTQATYTHTHTTTPFCITEIPLKCSKTNITANIAFT